MRVIDERISDFIVTLNLGLEWIGDAGKKLVAMLDTNPSAFDDILETKPSPWLTREVLQTIEAIGRGQISPEILVLPMHVLNRLSALPTDMQIKAMQGVDVAVPPRNGKGGWHRVSKPACRLTPRESQRAIGPDGIRPVEDQIGMLSRPKPCVLGKYQVVMEDGQEPKLGRIINGEGAIPDYQKQRVKLVNGRALIEFYL